MKIAVIGAGWLGLPLAQHLQQRGHQLVVSKTDASAAAELVKQGFDAVTFTLGDDLTSVSLAPLFGCEVMIINIAPGRKSFDAKQFETNMQALFGHAKRAGVSQIVFVSTTSVYGDTTRTIYEYSPLSPQTQSAQSHVVCEQQLHALYGQQCCVIRLAGLVAKDRHPAKYLSAKRDIANGQQRVNLVHRDDVIDALTAIVEQAAFGRTYHLSALQHPRRDHYYSWACQQLGLPSPHFSASSASASGKTINCELTLALLGLELEYPDPRQMLLPDH